jgi:hypothetical protein
MSENEMDAEFASLDKLILTLLKNSDNLAMVLNNSLCAYIINLSKLANSASISFSDIL